jgi:Putative metal-binding motif
MMMMMFLATSPAWAFELVADRPATYTTADVTALLVAEVDGGAPPDLMLAFGDELYLIATDGIVAWEVPALGLAAVDLDGDLLSELLACTADGLYRVDFDGTATALTSKACVAVAGADLDLDGDVDIVTADTAVLYWENTSDGLVGPTDHDVRLSGTPLLAAVDDAVWAGEVGGSVLYSYDLDGGEHIDAGGALSGLASAGSVFAWSVPELRQVLRSDGEVVDVQSDPSILAGGLVGSEPIFALLHPTDGLISLLGRATIGSANVTSGTRGPSQMVLADHDGDSCPDLVIANERTVEELGGDCTEEVPKGDDSDLDGWTTEDGDCNDDDGTVYPGAAELCDEQDNDCNGETDETLLEMSQTAYENNEGGKARLRATVGGCYDELAWEVDDADELLDCVEQEADDGKAGLDCTLLDEGSATVALVLTSGATQVEEQVGIEIYNVDPVILSSLDDQMAYVDTQWDVDLRAQDLGVRDELVWSVEGGPPGLELDDDRLSYTAVADDVGSWQVTVRVDDGDGGSAERIFYIYVSEDDSSSSTFCCCFGVSAAFAPIWLLALARARGLSPA